jgi:membrane-bound lytic murein transglycosylase D
VGLILLSGLSASAGPLGPGKGGGARAIAGEARLSGETAAPGSKAKPAFDHKQGRAPKTPAAKLPRGAARQLVDEEARRQVVGDVPRTAASERASDPQLIALREAERVLFPRSLVGFKPGWSWGDTDPSVQADGLPPVVEALPSATLAEAAHAEWLRSLAMPDFPVRLDERVVEYLRFYRDTDRGKAIAQVWARKVGRYTPAMRSELAKAGLPKDLVWLSLIESGHNPTIFSPAGAAGLWQFIPDTGKMYGLTVDKWVDERLDPQRSTQSAAAYLGDLYQRFGAWELAMAAYNMGHGGLLRAIRKYNTNDFRKLASYEAGLPWETTLYVPKVFAIAIVMNNRRAFGLDGIEPDPAITFDTVYVEAGVSLDDVARASGIPLDSLRTMNPQYRSRYLPPAVGEKSLPKWHVRVPRGLGAKTTTKLMKREVEQRNEAYVVRFGDTLESVALRRRTTVEELEKLNGLLPGSSLVAGGVLLVTRMSGESMAADAEDLVVVPGRRFKVPGRERVFYRVLRSDTLAGIANELEVTAEELVVWNDLDDVAKLQSGMVLQVYVPKHADLSGVRSVTSRNARVFEAGSEEFLAYVESQNGRRRIAVKAKRGDTLAKIGQRYGLSVGMMERINRFSRNRELEPGEAIIVYAKGAGKSAGASAFEGSERPRPLAKLQAPRPDVLPEPSSN